MAIDHRADHQAFVQETLNAWKSLLTTLFPTEIPKSANWTSVGDIVGVLNRVAREAPQNHMFFPNGGGMDLQGAAAYHEPGVIELQAGFPVVVKPKSLSFEYFGPESIGWSYFRLENAGLKPTGVYQDLEGLYEEVTELEPGKYVERSVWDRGYYGHDDEGLERPLPQAAKCISRYFDGAFVIVHKGSVYNQISDTYDGRHNKMSAADFYKFMKAGADKELAAANRPRYR
jgi:serine/threonine-protein kinase